MGETPVRQTNLQIGNLFNSAWEVFRENIGLFVGATALIGAILIVGSWFTFNLATIVLGGPLMLGYVALTMGLIRRQPTEFGLVFSGFQRFLPAFLAYLIVKVFTVIGLVLCILPGLFVSMLYMLTFFYMFDKKLDFWPAMEASRTTVMIDVGQWLLVYLVLLALNLVGCMLCGVGLLVTIPLSMLMLGLAYRQIEGEAAGISETHTQQPVDEIP